MRDEDEFHANFQQMHSGERLTSTPAIFMVVEGHRENVSRPIATGFFATDFGLFFTAAHVLPDASAPCSVVQFIPEEETFLLRNVDVSYRHRVADVAVGLAESVLNSSGERLENPFMALTSELPAVGAAVFSHGYPNTVMFPENIDQPTVIIPLPLSALGVVKTHYPSGRDRVLHPGHCIEVSFPSDPGASGSPVMDSHGRVFGVVSSSLPGGPSYVVPLIELFDAPFPNVRLRGKTQVIPQVRELLPFAGNAPPKD